MYRNEFKYFKGKSPSPSYSSVVDFSTFEEDVNNKVVRKVSAVTPEEISTEEEFMARFMIPPIQWKIYELTDKPGLIFVCNPFTTLGQRYWVYRCLKDYTGRPHKLNLDAHGDLGQDEDWWESCQMVNKRSETLRKKLRWATMGYHHNWNTKVYSEDERDPFPLDLAALSRYVARVTGFTEEFRAEAAIVNFYHFDSTLSGHTDHSEVDLTAPLFSFSFGQTAIFLLGGPSLEDKPIPLSIQSGDIVIMSGYSRQCYHGIPKILQAKHQPWDSTPSFIALASSGQSEKVDLYQALEESNDGVSISGDTLKRSRNGKDETFPAKRQKESTQGEDWLQSREKLMDDALWKPFGDYIGRSRINMNVRQVLPRGRTRLENKEK